MILLLILPFWVNEILRAFAFRILFGTSGVINAMLQSLGLVDQPIDFIRADVALYAGLSYAYVLLMVFPLYNRSEEHTSELQSLMRISYAVFCLKKKNKTKYKLDNYTHHINAINIITL